CLLLEHSGDRAQAVAWDPTTGARGREVTRWSLADQQVQALSPDGRILARSLTSGAIELLDLDDGTARTIALDGISARYLAWDADGSLPAPGPRPPEARVRLLRVRPGAEPQQVVIWPEAWYLDPVLDRDGRRLALAVSDMPASTWFIAR